MTITLLEFATPEYDEAVRLRYDVLREPLGLDFTAEDLEKEWQDVHFAAYDESDNLLGYMQLRVDAAAPKVARMKQVAVKASIQKKGVGTQMVAYFEKYCQAKGFDKIELHARDLAVPFYERLGYECFGIPFVEVSIPHREMAKRIEN